MAEDGKRTKEKFEENETFEMNVPNTVGKFRILFAEFLEVRKV